MNFPTDKSYKVRHIKKINKGIRKYISANKSQGKLYSQKLVITKA